MSTDSDAARIKAEVDAILERAGLQVTAEDYERLLKTYPHVAAQRAELAAATGPTVEPAMIYRAGS